MSTLRDLGMYEGRNPAHRIKIPRNARPTQKTRPYTLEELSLIVSRLESPLREMALLGTFTSLGGAELAGLRVGHLNLTDGYKWIERMASTRGARTKGVGGSCRSRKRCGFNWRR